MLNLTIIFCSFGDYRMLLRASWTESEIIGRLDTPENNDESTL